MENRCNIPDMVKVYGWHNDAGLATQYKPVSVGNRVEGMGQDFVNENIEMVRKLSLRCNSLTLMIMRVVMFNCWMKLATLYCSPSVARLYCLTPAQISSSESYKRNP